MSTATARTTFIGLVGVVLLLLAAATPAPAAAQYRVRLAHEYPATESTPHHRAILEFSEAVAEATGGRFQIAVYGGGALGPDRELTEQVRLGAIQMAIIGVATQAPLDQRFSIEELPYAWDSIEQTIEAYEGDLGAKIREMMLSYGIRPLAFWPFGFRHITNSVRPVRTPDDVRGLKLRSAEVPLRLDMFRTMGAQVIPVAFPELFTALQQRTVDGQENPLFLIYSNRFFEVQRYLSLTGHIFNTVQVVTNDSFYRSLPSDIRGILDREAIRYRDRLVELLTEQEAKALVELQAAGMTVTEVDKAAFRRAMAPVYDKYRNVFGPELMGIMERYSSIGAR